VDELGRKTLIATFLASITEVTTVASEAPPLVFRFMSLLALDLYGSQFDISLLS
jgi:hypothetical protein